MASGSAATESPTPPVTLKVTIAAVKFVSQWKWAIDEEDVCGICRIEFEKCCPACKIPGDDCPPVWGACNHTFHMHCIMKWLDAQKDKAAECPLCRRPWEFRSETVEEMAAGVDTGS